MKNEIQIDLQPVQTKRASEEIYNQIRQLILDGEIHPGVVVVKRQRQPVVTKNHIKN